VTGDLLAVNNKQCLYRASMTTRTLLTGWNGISLTSFGLLDTRAVEVIGEQVLVTDGADSAVRPHTDPMSHAVFVLDVRGPAGPAPTANFTATPTSGTVPLTVNFTDTSAGGPTSWAWDFGDGGTSTAQSPSHTYTSTGTFTAGLTATNELGSTSTTRTITVNEAPTEFTVALDADTYVNTSSPTKNYAIAPTMKLKFEPPAEYRSLVRFTLNGLSGPPTSVRLRLYVEDASARGGDWYLVSNDWTESTVVWGNKPAISGSPVTSAGAVTVGTWVEVNLTSAITGNGTYSFEATTTSTNTAAFETSQATHPPQVVVVA
jgi:trimeric autotransporter adhesin